MNRRAIKAAAGVLSAVLLIALCSCSVPSPDEPPAEIAELVKQQSSSAPSPSPSPADMTFAVRYRADRPLNPITGTDPDNAAIAPLMYEGLFVLNEKLQPQPVLCKSYSTSDGIHFTFRLKPGVAMSDGSTLTASDVKYSLYCAMQAGRFAGRLKDIESISADGPLTLTVTLKSPNYKLPSLLDIPIIKYGTIDSRCPPGTGPYYFDESTGTARLVALPKYRSIRKLPILTIYLKDCSDEELPGEFSSRAVDLFWDDPADSTEIRALSDHEVRYYDTTILQFVGFNVKNRILSNPDFRRALGLAIDREKVLATVYSAHGVASPLVLSPNYALYDPAWEPKVDDPLSEISAIFASLDMQDSDSDGFLEYRAPGGGYVPFSLNLIVNGDNLYKVAAAEMVVNSLKTVGINVSLSRLPWNAYMEALKSGRFDMYYADILLPADYDLRELLSPGGPLDYGHAGSSSYVARINAFLAAPNEDAEKIAAAELCRYVYENAPIIPVLYRQYAVHSNRNTVSGLRPTQSSIFFGLTSWTINLG